MRNSTINGTSYYNDENDKHTPGADTILSLNETYKIIKFLFFFILINTLILIGYKSLNNSTNGVVNNPWRLTYAEEVLTESMSGHYIFNKSISMNIINNLFGGISTANSQNENVNVNENNINPTQNNINQSKHKRNTRKRKLNEEENEYNEFNGSVMINNIQNIEAIPRKRLRITKINYEPKKGKIICIYQNDIKQYLDGNSLVLINENNSKYGIQEINKLEYTIDVFNLNLKDGDEYRANVDLVCDELKDKYLLKNINLIIKLNNSDEYKNDEERYVINNIIPRNSEIICKNKIYFQYKLNQLILGNEEIEVYGIDGRKIKKRDGIDIIKDNNEQIKQYWYLENNYSNMSAFGSAGKRSKKQKELVKKYVEDIIKNIGKDEIIISTDGGADGNPGPAGAGAMIIFGKESGRNLKIAAPIGKNGTNNQGEAYGIGMAFVSLFENE